MGRDFHHQSDLNLNNMAILGYPVSVPGPQHRALGIEKRLFSDGPGYIRAESRVESSIVIWYGVPFSWTLVPVLILLLWTNMRLVSIASLTLTVVSVVYASFHNSNTYERDQAQPAFKPNFLFIMTDDQDLQLDSLSYTPLTMKHMAEKGTTFANHFVTTALCCPSRVSLLTGRQAHNTNVTDVNPPWGKIHYNSLKDTCFDCWATSQAVTQSSSNKVSTSKRKYFCDNCHRIGHSKEHCFAKGGGKEHEAPEWFKKLVNPNAKNTPKKNNNAATATSSQVPTTAYIEELPESPKKVAHVAMNVENQRYDPSSALIWLVDSGAFTFIPFFP